MASPGAALEVKSIDGKEAGPGTGSEASSQQRPQLPEDDALVKGDMFRPASVRSPSRVKTPSSGQRTAVGGPAAPNGSETGSPSPPHLSTPPPSTSPLGPSSSPPPTSSSPSAAAPPAATTTATTTAAASTSPSIWTPPVVTTERQLKAALKAISRAENLPEVPVPKEPVLSPTLPMIKKIAALQRFIESFEYNYTGKTYVSLRKDRGLGSVWSSAKQIIAKALPIQCIEAVFLGAYLTREMTDLVRIPVSFKSIVNGHVFRHIILAVKHKSKWGALGLSRKSTLMYKELSFSSFADLMKDYKMAYSDCWHRLIKVYVGLPMGFEAYSHLPIKWRVAKVRMDVHPWDRIQEVLNRFARDAPGLGETNRLSGGLTPAQTCLYRLSGRVQKPKPVAAGPRGSKPMPSPLRSRPGAMRGKRTTSTSGAGKTRPQSRPSGTVVKARAGVSKRPSTRPGPKPTLTAVQTPPRPTTAVPSPPRSPVTVPEDIGGGDNQEDTTNGGAAAATCAATAATPGGATAASSSDAGASTLSPPSTPSPNSSSSKALLTPLRASTPLSPLPELPSPSVSESAPRDGWGDGDAGLLSDSIELPGPNAGGLDGDVVGDGDGDDVAESGVIPELLVAMLEPERRLCRYIT